MAKERKNSFFKKNADLIVLVGLTVVFSCLSLVGGVFTRLESRAYDVLLSASKEPLQGNQILLVEIDDDSIEEIGTWPWTRDILGNALVRMKELGANTAVFDIEYLEPSARVSAENAEDLALNSIYSGEQQIADALDRAGRLVEDGTVKTSSVRDYLNYTVMREQVDPVLSDVAKEVLDSLSRNNDAIFAQSVQFFSNAWLTMNLRNVHNNPSGVDYAKSRFLLKNVSDPDGLIEKGNAASFEEETESSAAGGVERSLVPALETIIDHAAGAGFTNVFVDRDGTRRRIELLNQYDGLYAGQLSFAPLLSYLNVKSIERKGRSLLLHDAHIPGEEKPVDIQIPLDEKGRMLINWQHGEYADSFRHESVMFLYLLDQLETDEVYYISSFADYISSSQTEAASLIAGKAYEILGDYSALQKKLDSLLSRCYGFDEEGMPYGEGLTNADYDEYFALRNDFYKKVEDFVGQNLYLYGDSMDFDEEERNYYDCYADAISSCWDVFSSYLSDMKKVYKDSVCFIGFTAATSTDFGVTPFARSYANLGTHANVFNTIIQRDFITPLPVWWGIVLTFVVSLVVILLCRKLKTAGRKNLLSLVYVLLPLAVLSMLMIFWKIYIPIIIPMLIAVITYITLLVIRFVEVMHQSTFLKNTFGAYVAPEVVSQIIKNPEVAQLGGSDKNITALFSDVKSFSKFSETVNDPVRLVHILIEYLGALSDAIMDNRGTIDKYVGDEIVSFFGAPIDNPSHAFDALCAGIRMKQVEAEYNKKHYEVDHDIPFPLESRVGVNTGLMVVGNMGTEKKLNYTIMGNNVNLASRLEGVNKSYGTWIMCSQSSWEAAESGEHKGELLARELDYVRVININTPVRIFSVVGKKSELTQKEIESAGLFNEGSALYLKREFEKAKKLFEESARCNPLDGSSEVFVKRCEQFMREGIPADWDGVYTMATK